MRFGVIIVFTALLTSSASAFSAGDKLRDLQVDHPYARSTVPNQRSGAAYLSIENHGKNTDKLLSAATPIADAVQIHTMSMDGNIMKMREVADIELKPSSKVMMKPGAGYHFMLVGLKKQLKAGDKFPLTLAFEKSGKLDVSVRVEDKDAPLPPEH